MAIEAALKAKKNLGIHELEMGQEFLKAADLIATKYRSYMNGTTMLGQSKNAFQAEIDSACEIIDFYASMFTFWICDIRQQPISGQVCTIEWNIGHFEGFVLAVTLLILPLWVEIYPQRLPCVAIQWCGNVLIHRFIRHKCSCVFYRKQVCRMVLSIWFM